MSSVCRVIFFIIFFLLNYSKLQLPPFPKQDLMFRRFDLKTSLLRRLQTQTLPDATPPIVYVLVYVHNHVNALTTYTSYSYSYSSSSSFSSSCSSKVSSFTVLGQSCFWYWVQHNIRSLTDPVLPEMFYKYLCHSLRHLITYSILILYQNIFFFKSLTLKP